MEILNFKVRNQQFQNMKEQQSQHNRREEQGTNFLIKSFRFFKKMSPLLLFQKNSEELDSSKEDEQLFREKIKQNWYVVDRDQQDQEDENVDEQDNDKKGYEDEKQEEFDFDSDEDDIQLIKFNMRRLLKAYQKLNNEKKKLQEENIIMRRQLEEWLKSPIKIRKYARIQGQLRFDEECDQVKVEKSSFFELEGEEDN